MWGIQFGWQSGPLFCCVFSWFSSMLPMKCGPLPQITAQLILSASFPIYYAIFVLLFEAYILCMALLNKQWRCKSMMWPICLNLHVKHALVHISASLSDMVNFVLVPLLHIMAVVTKDTVTNCRFSKNINFTLSFIHPNHKYRSNTN